MDNVAGLYAGVRDSVLTNHGVDQANKLGEHLAKTNVVLTNVFASPLTRTSKTAEAIRKAQATAYPDTASSTLEIVKVPELIEQDFGYYEGKSFQSRSADSKKTGREAHRDKHKDDAGFVDVESKESMAKRADHFLDQHLLPLFDFEVTTEEYTVAIVSHGILLSNLWRRLLLRLPRRSLTIAREITAARGDITLEHLGGWSNTGYLHLTIRRDSLSTSHETRPAQEAEASDTTINTANPSSPVFEVAGASTTVKSNAAELEPDAVRNARTTRMLDGFSTKILAVDDKQHLVGLKRQRGGIGRSAHDETQKKLDGFFKKQRVS